jgi:hypothetical protein
MKPIFASNNEGQVRPCVVSPILNRCSVAQPPLMSGTYGMAVLLTKIVDGHPAISDTLPNQQTVKCSRCEQTYRLGYSDDEWHKLSTWLGKAQTVMRESHKKRHDADVLQLCW